MASRFRVFILLLAFVLCFSSQLQAAQLTPDEQKLVSSISGAHTVASVGVLCSDKFAGRKAGQPGQALAAQYIAERFAALSMPKLAGSYLQELTMRYTIVKSMNDVAATLSFQNGSQPVTRDFSYPDYYGRGGVSVKAPVVFIGKESTGASKDGSFGVDLTGKIAVWIGGDRPGTCNSSTLTMLTDAYKHGAAASLVVGLKTMSHQECGAFGLAGPIADFPCLSIRPELARALFPGAWDKLSAGRKADGASRVGKTVSIKVPAIYNPAQPTQNVLCLLPGSDPDAGLVLLGAHYDHLGWSNGHLHRGADDNASGSAVMLEVARAFAKSGVKPKRGIVFAAWTAEEAGLVGSNYFAKSPPFALEDLKAALNMDMVGVGSRGFYSTVGQKAYPGQYVAVSTSAMDLGLTLLPNEVRGVSDHLAFSRKGVPSLLLTAAGEHPNYHTPKDRPELIDSVILEDTAKLAALSIWRLANNDSEQTAVCEETPASSGG